MRFVATRPLDTSRARSVMIGEYLCFCFATGMSVLDGGEEGADDCDVPLFELELSASVDVVGGDDPRGEGF